MILSVCLAMQIMGYQVFANVNERVFESLAKVHVSSKAMRVKQQVNSPQFSEENLRGVVTAFWKNLPSDFELDSSKMEIVGDYSLSTLKNGDWILSDHPLSLVDSFSKRTGAVATFFVKMGNEFVRQSTSLRTEKQEDAAGTILQHTNPAYSPLMQGESYMGEVELFGQQYSAYYDVIRDKEGQVIGAYFIGFPFEESSKLQAAIHEFTKNLAGDFALDPKQTEALGAYSLPLLVNGDWMLNDQPLPLVDSFSKKNVAVATFFVKSDNEFIRESTSLKKEKMEDAAGTILLHTNPAYDALMRGESFTGTVDLFGMNYYSYYDVIRNKAGEVIGAYFIGIPESMISTMK